MFDKQIEVLKRHLTEGEEELRFDETSLEEQIEREAADFFSSYGEEVPDHLKQKFKTSLRNIYKRKIDKKRAALTAIQSEIATIEQEYLDHLL